MAEATLKLHKNDENSMYVKEFLLYLKSDKGCRPKTIDVYRQDLEEYKKYFVTRDLLTLREAEVRQFKFWLVDKDLAPRTVNRMLSVVRSFYSYFVNSDEWENVTKNPAKNVPEMKVLKTEPVILNESQAETLLDGILLTGMFACRDYAIFTTFLFTGIRVSELIKLKICDVDFDNHLLHIRDGKGGKDRSIPMIPRLESAISVYLKNRVVHRKVKTGKSEIKERLDRSRCGREYFIYPGVDHGNILFLTKTGTKFSDKGIDYLFKSYTKKLGIYREKLTLHAMRRSCLTFLYKQGVDIFVLKEISGHVRVQTLEHYLRVDKAKVLAAMQRHPLARQGIDMNLVDLIRGKEE